MHKCFKKDSPKSIQIFMLYYTDDFFPPYQCLCISELVYLLFYQYTFVDILLSLIHVLKKPLLGSKRLTQTVWALFRTKDRKRHKSWPFQGNSSNY